MIKQKEVEAFPTEGFVAILVSPLSEGVESKGGRGMGKGSLSPADFNFWQLSKKGGDIHYSWSILGFMQNAILN